MFAYRLPIGLIAIGWLGDAPLATVVRLDRDVTALADEVKNLHVRLLDVFETAGNLLAGAPTRD